MQYGRAGARLVLAARRERELNAVAARARSAGAAGVVTVVADMSRAADCGVVVAAAVGAYGGLHTLVLNHARFDEGLAQLWNSTDDVDNTLIAQFATNVGGAAHAIRHALPHLIAARGHVAVVSSGSVRAPAAFHPGYVASKSGLHGLVDTMRYEWRLTGVPVTLGVMVLGMIATPEILADAALARLELGPLSVPFAYPVEDTAREMICDATARWWESHIPRSLAVSARVLNLPGLEYAKEAAINAVYVLKVPRYVDAVRAAREAVAAAAARAARGGLAGAGAE